MPTKQSIPKHIAVILDGNGRWAKSQGMSRQEGHRQGAVNVDYLLDTCIELKIKCVSLFAFSTENWKRPGTEVKALFSILNEFIINKLPRMVQNQIRLHVSGDMNQLPAKSRQLIEEAKIKTRNFSRLQANFCINYGSRAEIIRACQLLLAEKIALLQKQLVKNYIKHPEKIAALLKNEIKTKIQQADFEKNLYTNGLPEVDLLIRTAGEQRLSNFLLYQTAYAELFFVDKTWPEFTPQDLRDIVSQFGKRTRKFGGLK